MEPKDSFQGKITLLLANPTLMLVSKTEVWIRFTKWLVLG
jgi:hypothetical protein